VILRRRGRWLKRWCDIREMRPGGVRSTSSAQTRLLAAYSGSLRCRCRLIAAVHGFCLGGGGPGRQCDVDRGVRRGLLGLKVKVDRIRWGRPPISAAWSRPTRRGMCTLSGPPTAAELKASGSVWAVVHGRKSTGGRRSGSNDEPRKSPTVIRVPRSALNGIDLGDVKGFLSTTEQGFTSSSTYPGGEEHRGRVRRQNGTGRDQGLEGAGGGRTVVFPSSSRHENRRRRGGSRASHVDCPAIADSL